MRQKLRDRLGDLRCDARDTAIGDQLQLILDAREQIDATAAAPLELIAVRLIELGLTPVDVVDPWTRNRLRQVSGDVA